jgi:preprotein translocase subunit SecG
MLDAVLGDAIEWITAAMAVIFVVIVLIVSWWWLSR